MVSSRKSTTQAPRPIPEPFFKYEIAAPCAVGRRNSFSHKAWRRYLQGSSHRWGKDTDEKVAQISLESRCCSVRLGTTGGGWRNSRRRERHHFFPGASPPQSSFRKPLFSRLSAKLLS